MRDLKKRKQDFTQSLLEGNYSFVPERAPVYHDHKAKVNNFFGGDSRSEISNLSKNGSKPIIKKRPATAISSTHKHIKRLATGKSIRPTHKWDSNVPIPFYLRQI